MKKMRRCRVRKKKKTRKLHVFNAEISKLF